MCNVAFMNKKKAIKKFFRCNMGKKSFWERKLSLETANYFAITMTIKLTTWGSFVEIGAGDINYF